MTNLLILASGAGTRNAMFTYDNTLPKCLMSVGSKTCLEAIVDSYDGLVDNVYVAVQTKHASSVQALIDFKHMQNITVVSFEPTDNAYASVVAALRELGDYVLHNWYLNWSDVFVDKMQNAKSNTIFCDNKYRHRNLAYLGEQIAHVVSTANMHGNVPGIFYVDGETLQYVMQCVNRDDLEVDMPTDLDILLSLYAQGTTALKLTYLDDMHDIGDFDKYNAYMQSIKTDNVCRYFNSIKIDKDKVEKRPVTPVGEKLHEIELAYYRAYSNKDTAMAKLLGYDASTKTMTLERVKGQTCQSFIDAKPVDSRLSAVNSLIRKFDKAVAKFDDVDFVLRDTDVDKVNALREEFAYAINKRVLPCASMIEDVLKHYDGIKTVDGLPISTYGNMLRAVNLWLTDKIAENYFDFGIVHGDPNTDNCLISKGEIKFVDPRGYFGGLNTLGLGVKQYDKAKFVYGFSGYSKFNSAEYIAMQQVGTDLQFYVGPQEQQGITDVDLFDMNVDDDIKILVGIIWVKLTSYIINDPMKSVAAYLHGNAILTKLLNIKHLR